MENLNWKIEKFSSHENDHFHFHLTFLLLQREKLFEKLIFTPSLCRHYVMEFDVE